MGVVSRPIVLLFTVLDDQKVPTVRILHVRNASQRTLGELEEED
jgi:hypothetical protein